MSSMALKKLVSYSTVFLAEFLASAFLVFVGCLGSIDNSPFYTPTPIGSNFVWGIAVMVGINSFGAISGGFMTPIITFAAFIQKLIDIKIAIICFIAEILGSLFGYAVLREIISNDHLSKPDEFCVIQPNLSLSSAFFMEFIFCFIFITYFCSVIDARNAKYQDSVALRFGLLVMVILYVAGPLSGGGINPARAFAPAFYNQNWKNHWLYWLTSFSGALTSSLLYKHVFSRNLTKKSRDELQTEEVNIMK